MKKPIHIKLLLIFSIFCGLSCAPHADPKGGSPGSEPIDDFALLDNAGKFQELYYYSDMRAVVLISQQDGCPIIQKNYLYLEQLKKKYGPLGVVFLMINANPYDDRDSINQEAKVYHVDIPILEDKSQIVTEALGFKRTAEALLVNPHDWSIVYRGVINDRFGYDLQIAGTVHNYLEDAIKALLANKQVPAAPSTQIKGCLFSFTAKAEKPPTYVKDIAPILINKCIICHSPGQIAPWSMDNYEKVRSQGAMIREVIRVKRMPPWGADPFYGNLKDDGTLTPQEAQLIVHWVEQGMVRGDGEDPLLKAPRPAADGWPLGQPDFIVSFKDKQSFPPGVFNTIRNVEGDKILDQDRWVRQIYWKIGNRRIVHHAHIAIIPASASQENWFSVAGGNDQLTKMDISNEEHFIDGYTPGVPPLTLPDSLGIFFPKGSRFYFNVHYTLNGEPDSDYTQVGLYFYKSEPSEIKVLSGYKWVERFNPPRFIPANTKEYKVKRILGIKSKITLLAIKPHMHLLGRSQKFIVHYPDGSSKVILSVPRYRFNWQLRYWFKEPLVLPAGTDIEVQALYDNSAQNLDDPNPNKPVEFGLFTWNEMMGSIFYYEEDKAGNVVPFSTRNINPSVNPKQSQQERAAVGK